MVIETQATSHAIILPAARAAFFAVTVGKLDVLNNLFPDLRD